MTIYLRSISGISPGAAPGAPVAPATPVIADGNRLHAIEPEYSQFMDARQLRRTSRIVRMGVAAAMHCLREAGGTSPDAIVTGTAYGCLEDTGVFLGSLVRQKEGMLSPTSFIQSTHNTVGAQIALLLQCTGYNSTYVHRGLSFESALLDAMLLLADKEAQTVLAGAMDEITGASQILLQRFGLCRLAPIGEGAFFFLLAGEPSDSDWACLDGLHTFHGPLAEDGLSAQIREFLAARSLNIADIDHVLLGTEVLPAVFAATPCTAFKPFCGDYPTASSFALGWAASEVKKGSAGRILICNSWLDCHHSLMLVSHVER